MIKKSKIRVLIADNDGGLALRLKHYLESKEFLVKLVRTGSELKTELLEFRPRFVLADLVLSECSAIELIDHINAEKKLDAMHTQVLVMSNHNDEYNVRQAMERGARDWLVKPFQFDEVLKRLLFHCRSLRLLQDPNHNEVKLMDDANRMLHLTQLVLRESVSLHTLEMKLLNLTKMINTKVSGVRCSIVEALTRDQGIVVTSNDNRDASGLEINLNNYPEIQHVMERRQLVVIENLRETDELKGILERLQEVHFNALITAPLIRAAKPFGVLSVRLPPGKTTLADQEVRFVEIVAQVASLLLTAEYSYPERDFWQQNRRRPEGTLLTFPTKK
jgi:DNA-binding response OmpR family regulator